MKCDCPFNDLQYRPPQNLWEWMVHKYWLWQIRRTLRHNMRIANQRAENRAIFEKFWNDPRWEKLP